ncbi:MAG: shikimate dehydrogenase [Planctomycetota bacterium]|nr:shikimate dehydrogenase [Planctomycetota bacterium]
MPLFTAPRLYGIIGNPLGHSLSPAIHTTAFRALGIPGVLLPWTVPPEKLADFIQAVRLLDIQGCCVTIPHKQSIIPLLDGISDLARTTGAVNTLYRRDNLILGDNTDVSGFIEPLLDQSLSPDTPTLLLGAGGAARAVVTGLARLGQKNIRVTSPNPERANRLAREFSLEALAWEDRLSVKAGIVINATPLGMLGEHVGESPVGEEFFRKNTGTAYDLVYRPAETVFIRQAREAGWRCIGGFAMFVSQADQQFLTWTGEHLPEEARHLAAELLV